MLVDGMMQSKYTTARAQSNIIMQKPLKSSQKSCVSCAQMSKTLSDMNWAAVSSAKCWKAQPFCQLLSDQKHREHTRLLTRMETDK